MPHLDYFITTDVELTKDKVASEGERPLLTPDLDLGARKWNKKHLEALRLVLCNLVKWGHRDKGVFLYSRDKKQIPKQYNPYEIGYSSLFWVIDALTKAKLMYSIVDTTDRNYSLFNRVAKKALAANSCPSSFQCPSVGKTN